MEKTPRVVFGFDLNELPYMDEEPNDDVAPLPVDMNEELYDDVAPLLIDMNEEFNDDVAPPQVDMNEEPNDDMAPPQVDMNEEPNDVMAPPQVDMNEEPNDDMAPRQVDMNEEPNDDVAPPQVEMNEEPNDDVVPPPPLCILLHFHKEDMEVLKQKYKVLGSSSSVENDEYLKKLGFPAGSHTLMHIRNKRVQIARNISYSLGRSWLKRVTKKDKGIDRNHWKVSLQEAFVAKERKEGTKKKDKGKAVDIDHLEAKKLLQEFVMLAKSRISAIRKKGKKKVHFVPPPCHDGIKEYNFVPKKRSLDSIITYLTKRIKGKTLV